MEFGQNQVVLHGRLVELVVVNSLTLANFTLHGDSGVNFNSYGPSCSGAYTNGVPNDGDYMQLCASSHP